MKMNREYVIETCKLGQGHDCCRYLLGGPKGFECAKNSPALKLQLDARGDSMVARGDNCEGAENEND